MLIKGFFQTEEKLSKKDKIRRNVISFIVFILAPLISFIIYWKIVGDEFIATEAGLLILIPIVVISSIGASLFYEYLFPNYKKDDPYYRG